MPSLNWIGKDKVINHHHDVPFRILVPQYSYGDDSTQNRIIHGDNLEALKALLPFYEGRIKCIYIDPPYNTGNENWIYNDNVSDPKLKRWLGKVVGKESEDLSRHDKWLCMMYPRLQLLHRLLAEDGAIFISIDDNEQANLRLIMDEIWGLRNFVSCVVWQKKHSPQADATYFSDMHDFLIVFAKKVKTTKFSNEGFDLKKLDRSKTQNDRYQNPDDDIRGVWTSDNYTCNKNSDERPNLYYPVVNPNTGEEIWPSKTSVWRYSKERHEENLQKNLVIWGADGKGRPRFKRFVDSVGGVVPSTWWSREFAGDNQNARKELRRIFNQDEADFSTPKPTTLLERVLSLASGPDDIILDSFAGSGTTAHAVLNLNKLDGGNRQFILVEMEEYAETITAERVRRVINGYGDKEGTGGGFAYYELGPTLFTDDGLLNEVLPLARIREYIWYSETRLPFSSPAPTPGETPHFLGRHYETAYYFFYERNELTTLDYDFLATVQTPADQYVIYADNCLINREWLQQRHIIFKKIPRDISRF